MAERTNGHTSNGHSANDDTAAFGVVKRAYGGFERSAVHQMQHLQRRFTDLVVDHPTGLCRAVSELAAAETGLEICLLNALEREDGDEQVRARIVAAAGRPDSVIGQVYGLEGTPCADVDQHCYACICDRVRERFPQDTDLTELGVVSYAGVALTDIEGENFGSIVCMSTKPIDDEQHVVRTLMLIGQRFAFEVQRRRGEGRLEASEGRYRALVESMPDGLVVHQDGRIVYANPAAARIRGLDDCSRVIGRPSTADCGDGVACPEDCSGIFNVGEKGREMLIDCISASIVHEGRHAVQVIERDVTRRNPEEARLLRAFDHWHEAMFVLERDARAARINRAMRELLGVDADVLAGSVLDHLPEGHAGHVRTLIQQSARSDVSERVEFSVTDGDDSVRSFLWSAYTDPDDGSVTMSCIDTTSRRQAEFKLRQAERAHTTALLTSGLAHDLGNLFSAISGHTHIACSKLALDHPARPAFDDLEEVLAHARELKDTLQTLGGDGGHEEREVDLGSLVEDSRPLLERLLRGRATLRVVLDRSSPLTTRGDEYRLRQVLVNLVANARDAIASEQRIDGAIALGVAAEDEWVRLDVTDNGPGIREEVIGSIFEPFFTTRGRSSGTGLGLALCRAIVESHHGAVTAQSRFGHGARFRVWLPALRATDRVVGAAAPDLEGLRVAFAYPQGQEREIVMGMLEHLGLEEAAHAHDADVIVAKEGLFVDGAEHAPRVVIVDGGPEACELGAVPLRRPFGRDALKWAVSTALSRAGYAPTRRIGS